MTNYFSDSDDGDYGDSSIDATARIVDAGGDDDERRVEAALRPRRLSEFPGQTRVCDQLSLVLEAAKRRATPPDHVLLSGPPGLGKTTLALIVAAEFEKPIRICQVWRGTAQNRVQQAVLAQRARHRLARGASEQPGPATPRPATSRQATQSHVPNQKQKAGSR